MSQSAPTGRAVDVGQAQRIGQREAGAADRRSAPGAAHQRGGHEGGDAIHQARLHERRR